MEKNEKNKEEGFIPDEEEILSEEEQKELKEKLKYYGYI
jgi:spore maturation protein CgeB